MVKLLPRMGSRNVPDALNRQEPAGNVAGRKMVNPRLALTSDQSVIVVGVPLAGPRPFVFAEGVLLAVACTAVVLVGVACAVVVLFGVAPGVAFAAAARSRKDMSGFPHQCSVES